MRPLFRYRNTPPEDLVDALDLRAVGVLCGLALGVVLAMDGRPLLGDHAGGQPQPEAEEMRHHWVQIDRAMRLTAMQVYGDRGDCDVGKPERDEHIPPPWEVEKA